MPMQRKPPTITRRRPRSTRWRGSRPTSAGKRGPRGVDFGSNVGHNRVAINFMWTLVTGFLVMFMQAGFALVETGLCRAKNASHTMSMNFMIYPMGMLGFYLCGFAFMFGGLG